MAKGRGGRPSTYSSETYPIQAQKLCQLGATDEEIADFFNVDVRTIYRWKNDHPEFCQALKVGKDIADDRVERSLYQKAVGYRAKAVKIFMPAGAPAPVYAEYIEEHAPDTTACIFWLKNRREAAWRDKSEVVKRNIDESLSEEQLADLRDELLEEIRASRGDRASTAPQVH